MAVAQSLFAKLGGEKTIEAIVDEFYRRILADPTVNHFFKHTDMVKQRRHQAAFISYALGSGRQYTGKSMAKAHEGMNLQPVHYDAVVGHLKDTLKQFQVSDEDIREVEKTIGALRDDILYK